MMPLKEFQQDVKLYLSIIDTNDDKHDSGSSFIVYLPLHRPKASTC